MRNCLRGGDKEWLFSPFGRMSAMRREHPGWMWCDDWKWRSEGMGDTELTQALFEDLHAMQKKYCGECLNYPSAGEKLNFEVKSIDDSESFIIDVSVSRMTLNKVTHQERYRKTIPLVRIDINGPQHINPDGKRVSGNHIHLYREGYGDAFAIELPDNFDKSSNYKALMSFLRYCNVLEPSKIVTRGLFNG